MKASQVWVVFGASNVARSRRFLVELAAVSGVRDLVLCAGHGRSVALETSVLGRRLPSWLDALCWQAESPVVSGEPADVIITDVGNDLLYGAGAARTGAWVRRLVERLPATTRLTLVLPPLVTVASLSPFRFHLFRRLFFPGRRISWSEMQREVAELERELRRLAGERGARLVEPLAEWYGLDPIHIVRSRQRDAWRRIAGDAVAKSPEDRPPAPGAVLSLRERVRLARARPASWRLGRLELGQAQPLELRVGSRAASCKVKSVPPSDRIRLWQY